MPGGIVGRTLSCLVVFLAISAGYLYAFPQPNIPYAGVVLLHAAAGLLAAILLIPALLRLLREGSFSARAGWVLIAAGAILGLILIKTGTPRSEWNKFYLHIVISTAGIGLLMADWLGKRGGSESGLRGSSVAAGAMRIAICLAVLAGIGYGERYVRQSWQTRNQIQNPPMPPAPWTVKATGPKARSFPVRRRFTASGKSPANSSWSPTPASAATKTSTTSGSARPITSLPSTISGTARD